MYWLYFVMPLAFTACVAPTTDVVDTDTDADDIIVKTGPAESATVDLASADVWFVPEIVGQQLSDPPIIWTLTRPADPALVKVIRWCRLDEEPGLQLHDTTNVWPWGVAKFSGCSTVGQFRHATVELVFTGERWLAVSATGGDIAPPDYFE